MELRTRLLLIMLLFLPAFYTKASDWPQWRGPSFSGSTDETNLPDKLNDNNMLWSVELPGPSAATPVIYNSKIFINSTDSKNEDLLAICFDASTGEQLWQKKLSTAQYQPPRNNLSSPSPVADEHNVYFLCGNGDISCLDHQGNIIWSRKLADDFGPFSLKYGYSSSPLLLDDVLYILLSRREKPYSPFEDFSPQNSFLIALDAKTGKNVFSHVRTSDAVDETLDSYSTPAVLKTPDCTQIVIAAADYATGHDPKTGDELWRYQYDKSKNQIARNIPTPICVDNTIFITKPRGTQTFALKLDSKTFSKPEPLWTSDLQGPDCSTPAYYKDKLFIFDDRRTKILRCLNANNGQQLWSLKLDGSATFYASAAAAEDKIYCIDEAGKVFILSTEAPRTISTFELDEKPSLASIAIANGRLYIRTPLRLYCFAKKSPQNMDLQKSK